MPAWGLHKNPYNLINIFTVREGTVIIMAKLYIPQKSLFQWICSSNFVLYTAGWYVWGEWFLAVNHHNHKNWIPSILIHNLWLIFMGMKQKKNQNGRLKKRSIFKIANSKYFFVKISWIGPWVGRIEWCEGHWCG